MYKVITDVLDYKYLQYANQDKRKCTLIFEFDNDEEKKRALKEIVWFIDEYKADGWQETSDLMQKQQYNFNKDKIENCYMKRFEIPLR